MSETRLSRRDLVATAAVLPLMAAAASTPAQAQSQMRTALDHLRLALTALQNASAGKGGHRREAIRLVETAIKEVQLGIQVHQQNQ